MIVIVQQILQPNEAIINIPFYSSCEFYKYKSNSVFKRTSSFSHYDATKIKCVSMQNNTF